MTTQELKKLEENLWSSANRLRATGGIKSADYAVPVLGIIFLRFADNKYSLYEKQIIKEFEESKNTIDPLPVEKIALRICGFYLGEKSRYDYLLNLSDSNSIAKAIKEAMEDVESWQDEKFQDILPKDNYYAIEKEDKTILPELLKTFSDIPKDASGDVFGKIYEYFLGKFALSEGQKGGEFFTPTSVVRFIVEVIEPYSGKIFDPACGSGGMFVQSANFLDKTKHKREDIYVCGQENETSTVKLAKMNLLVNNLRGEIKKANSYEENPFESKNKFNYVMANPPFNIKGVKEATVKDDDRFNFYGLPKNKGKKDDKITDANYLWISLFATSLNETGKAGFVMPNSASDARNSEYEIRKKIVDSGIVDCLVTIPSNMFYTVTLPATLWFFDKSKIKTPREDKILFIDARNIFKQIDRAHREWTQEHVQNLSTIVNLYHGSDEKYKKNIQNYTTNLKTSIKELEPILNEYKSFYDEIVNKIEEKNLELNYTTNLEEINEILKAIKEQNQSLQEKLKPSLKKLKLTKQVKELDSKLEVCEEKIKEINYWDENISWLQTNFPEAKYHDVIGLCKVASRVDYIDEHDYSLNAGRYVGVALEEENITKEDFKQKILNLNDELNVLNKDATELETAISQNIKKIFNEVK
ncbi:type I restriction-modification system subunit M [Malaciobacter marinus]|uniref:type I restriction-modification system subunit M n=1 Tax=Malaciobacter marinus TaxID=505249 RepID=UPI003B0037C6